MSEGKVIDDGGSAFPTGLKGEVKCAGGRYEGAHVPEYDAKFAGMSLRDYFAGQALAAGIYHVSHAEEYALNCYEIADAMLIARTKAREKQE